MDTSLLWDAWFEEKRMSVSGMHFHFLNAGLCIITILNSIESNLLIFLFWLRFLASYLIPFYLTQPRSHRFSYDLFQTFESFMFYVYITISFNFCIKGEWWVKCHLFAYGHPIAPVSFVEKLSFFFKLSLHLSRISWFETLLIF